MHHEPWHVEISDNPIVALAQCFAESNLPHERISEHCLRLEVSGDWCTYDIVFEYLPKQAVFEITAALPTFADTEQPALIDRLLGRMNTELALGYFVFDSGRARILYRYGLPEAMLPALDFQILENMIESAIYALERLYPIAKSLLCGAMRFEDAIAKDLPTAEGTA